MALELAESGAAVIVHGRRREAADEVASRIRQQGGHAEVLIADLADPSVYEPMVARAWQWRDGVDIWINNAGADILTAGAARSPFSQRLEALWQVDVTATIYLSRLAGRRMKAAGSGAILNMGWDGVERGMAGDGGELFAAAKGAVTAFSRSLAQSLAPEVRVNCLAPGWIRTAWGREASEAWQQRAVAESLAGRWGTPEEVASLARFLVSPDARFVNGQVVCLNGGFRLPG